MIRLIIAGKNELAINGLSAALNQLLPAEIVVIESALSDLEAAAGPNFAKFAQDHGVARITLDEAKEIPNATFLSLEFDRIIRPSEFTSRSLVNVHLSNLPNFRGVGTSFWPIMKNAREAGVTLHLIDDGVDTGDVVAQTIFSIDPSWTSWDLHRALLFHAGELVKSQMDNLISGNLLATPQQGGGSYFSKSSVDFSKNALDHFKTWDDFDRNFRAMYFPKFQLPTFQGKSVTRATRLAEIHLKDEIRFEQVNRTYGLLFLTDALVALDLEK